MKYQSEIKRKIFGKFEDLPKFISWNTRHHGDKPYSIREGLLSEIINFNHPSISSKVNYQEKFFLLEEDPVLLEGDGLQDYLSKIDLEANYISMLETVEYGYTSIHMFGKEKHFKLYDSDTSEPVKYEDVQDMFIRFGIIWTYDLENLIENLKPN